MMMLSRNGVLSIRPFAGGSIICQQEHRDGDSSDEDERHNEGYTPCHVWGETALVHPEGRISRSFEEMGTITHNES